MTVVRRDLVIRLKRRRPGRPARREQRQALRGTELSSVTTTESPSDDEAASWPGAGTAAAFADAVDSGRLDPPFPGGGHTGERWAALAALAERDLSLARLAEGHTDALAITVRARRTPAAGRKPLGRLGRAAARTRPGRQRDRRAVAPGRHQAVLLGRTVVHGRAGDGGGAGWQPAVRGEHGQTWPRSREPGPPPAWPPATPSTSGSIASRPCRRRSRALFQPAGLRPRRRRGGRLLVRRRPRRGPDPAGRGGRTRHRPARAGPPRRVDIALRTAKTGLDQAADEIDADPEDRADRGRLRAPAGTCPGRSGGHRGHAPGWPGAGRRPLCRDEAHSRRVGRPDRVPASASRRTRPRRARRARGQQRHPVVTPQADAKPNRIDQPGTAAAAWAAWPWLRRLPSADPRAWASAVVIAAHPDDEVLGRGRDDGHPGRRRSPPAAGRAHRRRGVAPGRRSRRVAATRAAESAAALGPAGRPRRRGAAAAGCPTPGWPPTARNWRPPGGCAPASRCAWPPGKVTRTPTTRPRAARPGGPRRHRPGRADLPDLDLALGQAR